MSDGLLAGGAADERDHIMRGHAGGFVENEKAVERHESQGYGFQASIGKAEALIPNDKLPNSKLKA
jgi:hypothetical protein